MKEIIRHDSDFLFYRKVFVFEKRLCIYGFTILDRHFMSVEINVVSAANLR